MTVDENTPHPGNARAGRAREGGAAGATAKSTRRSLSCFTMPYSCALLEGGEADLASLLHTARKRCGDEKGQVGGRGCGRWEAEWQGRQLVDQQLVVLVFRGGWVRVVGCADESAMQMCEIRWCLREQLAGARAVSGATSTCRSCGPSHGCVSTCTSPLPPPAHKQVRKAAVQLVESLLIMRAAGVQRTLPQVSRPAALLCNGHIWWPHSTAFRLLRI